MYFAKIIVEYMFFLISCDTSLHQFYFHPDKSQTHCEMGTESHGSLGKIAEPLRFFVFLKDSRVTWMGTRLFLWVISLSGITEENR
jgi:hypothetical protein